jgi:hypothetical protein
MECLPNAPPVTETTQSRGVQVGDPSSTPAGNAAPVRIIVFDFETKQTESCVVFTFFFFGHDHQGCFWWIDLLIYYHPLFVPENRSTRLEGELTSMQITQDSQYALINHSENVRMLLYIFSERCILMIFFSRKSTFGIFIQAG